MIRPPVWLLYYAVDVFLYVIRSISWCCGENNLDLHGIVMNLAEFCLNVDQTLGEN